jgi:hypothetical protein
MAFLRGAGGGVAPPGPTAMGGAPDGGGGGDGIADLASMMGGGGDPAGGGGGPMPPELMKMMAAKALAPQVLAQQQTDYYKKFLHILVQLLGDLRREKAIGPRTSTDLARAQTQLTAAMAKLDKEKPEEAEPVNSLLAQGMMGKPQMAAGGGAPGGSLPTMR